MTTQTGFLQDSPAPDSPRKQFTPRGILISLIALIYLAETVTMIFLYFIQISNPVLNALLDGVLMIALILPALYWFQLRPLLTEMEVRAQAEAALRTSEAHLKRVMETLPVGVLILDKRGTIIQTNAATEEIWGRVHYVGLSRYAEYKGWWADTGKPVEPGEWAAVRAINKRKPILNEEINIEAFDGRQKAILNSAAPILDENGALQGVVVVNQDITRRRQMQNSLIQTNELLEKVFNSIGTLIAYLDKDFNFIRVNETYAASAGHPPNYFIGKNHFDLYPHEENEAIFRRVVATGEPFSAFEKPFENPEFPERGTTYWDWSLQPVKSNNGRVEGVVLSLVDVTERRRAEIQLERQNRELLALTNAEQKQRELAESLVQATIALTSSLKLEEVLSTILEQIDRVIPFQMADVALVDNGILRVLGYRGVAGHPEAEEAMGRTYAIEQYPLWHRAYATLQSFFISDTRTSPDWVHVPGMEWVLSFAAAPMVAGGKVIGFINMTSDCPGYFDEEKVARLTAFAVPAALAIQNARLYRMESDARKAAETLSIAAQALTRTLEIEQVIDTLMDYIQEVVHSEVAGIALMDDETHLSLRAARRYGRWGGTEGAATFPISGVPDPEAARSIAGRASFILPRPASGEQDSTIPGERAGLEWLIVPIIASDKVIGLVELGRVEAGFDPELIGWTEGLVGLAAVAIQNAWLFQQVRASSERLQSLARKLVKIQENERFHIARELHDEAGQALSLLKINLGRLQEDPECPPHVRYRLEDVKGVTDGVLEALHRLAIDLRPIALDHLGLVAALEQYAKHLNSGQLSVQFKAVGFEGERIPKDVETCLYRIVQEALANILRHARAATVGILLERVGDSVKLFVEDDGIGFDPAIIDQSDRLGLVGMRERAEMFDGVLTIESYPGKGTSVIVEVPNVNSYPYRG